MCRKKQFKYCPSEIDECMITLMNNLNLSWNYKVSRIVACCCGHGKYPMTIVIEINDKEKTKMELFTDKIIPRKKRFYKKDKEGYYYIPEVTSPKN